MEDYKYKAINSDFRVYEVLNVILDGGEYHYYLLQKRGLRTMEAIEFIAEENNISIADITYAGLKDEDAVTIQYISIKSKKIDNYSRILTQEKCFSIVYIGDSNSPIYIGKLQGNAFKIRIRNLDYISAEAIYMNQKHTFSIINYFDIQRFGMPERPKLTHIIGECLVKQQYEEALKFMLDSGNIDEIIYNEWKTKAKEYFDNLEIRKNSFFLSAMDSFHWNNNIQKIIRCSGLPYYEYNKQGILFLYSTLNTSIKEKLDNIPIIWHRYDADRNIYEKHSFRQSYIDIIYKSSDVMKDTIFETAYMVDIDFILPAGTYATNVVDQLIYQVRSNHVTINQ